MLRTDWVAGEGAAAGGKGYTGASGVRRALAWYVLPCLFKHTACGLHSHRIMLQALDSAMATHALAYFCECLVPMLLCKAV